MMENSLFQENVGKDKNTLKFRLRPASEAKLIQKLFAERPIDLKDYKPVIIKVW